MMPLAMVKPGEECTIKKIGGKEETRRFLENLGFVVGGIVTVVSEVGGNPELPSVKIWQIKSWYNP